MPTKTNWEDMALMGAERNYVFNTLNAKRGNTMGNNNDVHLNDSFTDHYGWYCYNKVTDQAVLIGSTPISINTTAVSYTWDNTDDKPWEETRTEKYTRSSTTSLSNKTSASVKLEQSITIAGIASSSISMSIGTESTASVSQNESEEQTASFKVTVQPGEKLQLIRKRMELGQTATYRVPYGIEGIIGTEGKKYNGHYHWGYQTGFLDKSLNGYYYIDGVNRNIDYSFSINRISGTGPVKSSAVYVNPLGPNLKYNVENLEIEIHDGEAPKEPGNKEPQSSEGEIPGY